jgi:hypothetical protein
MGTGKKPYYPKENIHDDIRAKVVFKTHPAFGYFP